MLTPMTVRPRAKIRHLPLFDSPLLSTSPAVSSDHQQAVRADDDLHQKVRWCNLNSVANLKMKAVDPNPLFLLR
jgi:hypothetical protein